MKHLQRFIFAVAALLSIAVSTACADTTAGLYDVIKAVERSFSLPGMQDFSTSRVKSTPLVITSFSANFIQRSKVIAEDRELRADGQLSVKMPDGRSPLKFHFEYFRPSRQEIVSNGRSLWIYHPENREVILADVTQLYSSPLREPSVNFLQGLQNISKDFQINFASGMYDSAGNFVLELLPRKSMLNTQKIYMVVNKSYVENYKKAETNNTQTAATSQRNQGTVPNPRSQFGTQPPFGGHVSDIFPILSTTAYDFLGNSTTIEFTNIQVNQRILDSEFEFIPPGTARVVRPNEKNFPQ